MPWEHAEEARAALNAIVTDPEHGVAALSSPRTMSNLLKDLLPDAPREKNLLVAAAEARLADTLREHVSQGMDSSTAIRLTASSFSARTPLTPDACSWVTGEIAVALGISETNEAVPAAEPQPAAGGSSPSGPGATEVSPGYDGRFPSQDTGQPFEGGYPSGRDSDSRVRDGASSAAGGFTAGGSAVVSPGQSEPSSYPPPGYQQPSPGYPQVSPGYPQGLPSQPPGQPGYQNPAPGYSASGSAYSSDSPGYAPPIGFSPALNPQAYGPGVAGGMPVMPGAALAPGYQPLPQPGIRPRTNTMAVTSLVLGVVQFAGWFIFLLPGLLAAILAIVLGFVSIQQMRRAGESGRGLAITGIVLGFLGIIVVGILAIVGLASVNSQT
jgi:Domain of unknown function (DUF4190)